MSYVTETVLFSETCYYVTGTVLFSGTCSAALEQYHSLKHVYVTGTVLFSGTCLRHWNSIIL